MKMFFKRAFYGAAILAGVALLGFAILLWRVFADLPNYSHLQDYTPQIMSRVHAADGELIAEFSEERRIFVPIEVIPKALIDAFLSSEDKNFYEHSGVDLIGIARATVANVNNVLNGRRLEGASTITQQIAKNFLLSSDVTVERKLKEAILAMRLERTFSKRGLLELYLNEIYLGLGSYGVAEASLRYFGKSLSELEIAEMAYLAALPKAPNNYHPFRRPARAIARRDWVIERMLANGYITVMQAETALRAPLGAVHRPSGIRLSAANHFVEEVRRKAYALYGQDELYGGGLSIRTTLDARYQIIALETLRAGLQEYDRRHGYRGALDKLELNTEWRTALRDYSVPHDVKNWDIAVVLRVTSKEAVIGLRPRKMLSGKIEPLVRYGRIALEDMVWAREAPNPERNNYKIKGPPIRDARQVFEVGDVIYVETTLAADELERREARVREHFRNVTAPAIETASGMMEALVVASQRNAEDIVYEFQPNDEDYFAVGVEFPYRLQQMPEIDGAVVAMDPHTGRIKAMVGGYSFKSSEFNRAVQAKRQPGSAFKPFVYATALDNGYTPTSRVLDAPFVMEQGEDEQVWKPENYGRRFYGPSTLRLGIEKSRNLMTIRMAQQMGIRKVVDYARRFDVIDPTRANLSLALGTGETSLLRITRAYAILVNGGKDVRPVLIDRVQNRFGKTIYRHDQRACPACVAGEWAGQLPPQLEDARAQIISPQTAYQVVSMLEGVVQRGTARFIGKMIDRPLGGKTGTTNDSRDAWFVGFSPDLAVGVFVGFDDNRPMGDGESGGRVAAPIFAEFMKRALVGQPATPFRIPDGVNLVRINADTGAPALPDDEVVILEAFKPGTAPKESSAFEAANIGTPTLSDLDNVEDGIGAGTGGLY